MVYNIQIVAMRLLLYEEDPVIYGLFLCCLAFDQILISDWCNHEHMVMTIDSIISSVDHLGSDH
jgi:hypothetical protein